MNAFDCQCCGHCCEGKGGIVVSPTDLERLCLHLNISQDEGKKQYMETVNRKLRLINNSSGFCIFFNEKQGCAVHEAKPDICRAWPFFRGNLVDSESLAMSKEFCPGIAPEISFTEFQKQGIEYLQKNNLIVNNTAKTAGALNITDLILQLKY